MTVPNSAPSPEPIIDEEDDQMDAMLRELEETYTSQVAKIAALEAKITTLEARPADRRSGQAQAEGPERGDVMPLVPVPCPKCGHVDPPVCPECGHALVVPPSAAAVDLLAAAEAVLTGWDNDALDEQVLARLVEALRAAVGRVERG